MSKLPVLTGRALISKLAKSGFKTVRVRGSHHYLRHEDGRSTVVPVHSGEVISAGLMAKILRDCELDREDI